MNNIILFLSFTCLCISLGTYAQVKKIAPQTKTANKAVAMDEKGPLDPKDYDYYFTVRRGNYSNQPGLYTLRDKAPSNTNIATPLIMMDARTMKELTWWPEVGMSVKKGAIHGYDNDRNGFLVTKYTTQGKLVFSKYLTWKTPTGEQQQLYKSNDDKQVYTVYNNDVWVGDYDLSSATSSNIHQVTQSGVMRMDNDSYLTNGILLVGDHVVNTKDGRFEKSPPHSYITSDSAHFYQVYNPMQILPQYKWLYSFGGWKQIYSLSGPTSDADHWINREQTKILWSKDSPGGKQTQFIRIYDPNTYPTPPTSVVQVPWSLHIATQPNQLWGPLLELALSPRSKYLFNPSSIPGTNRSGINIYNLETYEEYFLPIVTGQYPPDETAWTDDTHLIFTMRSDRMNPAMLNEQTRITSENQGTYILDVKTKQVKRLTPYLVGDYDKSFVRLLSAKTVLFEANNYIFRCNSDGTELTQLTKIPNVYKLAGAFIK